MAPGISGSPTRLITMSQAFLFCSDRWPPDVWKPHTSDYVAADVFYLKNGSWILGSPTRLTTLPQAFFVVCFCIGMFSWQACLLESFCFVLQVCKPTVLVGELFLQTTNKIRLAFLPRALAARLLYAFGLSIYNWLSGPGALRKPPLPHGARPGLLGGSRNDPEP